MFEAYFDAVLARNRLITETMIANQRLIADMFARHLDFSADFLQHQARVLQIVTQWRTPDTAGSAGAPPAETASAPPKLAVVRGRR
jgi:hypothetical protein